MARAPAQAGDAGSSPAPVTKPVLDGEPAGKKQPWSTPTVEEIPWDALPTELRTLVIAAAAPLDAAYQATTEKQPDAVADVFDQAEKAPPAADVISARPMLPGDRRRAEILARNQEALRRAEAEIRARVH